MTTKPPQYMIDPKKLEILRGRLIAATMRDVEWQEFARIVGVTPNTLSNIKHGRTKGSVTTARKIRSACAEHNVYVSFSDILSEVEK